MYKTIRHGENSLQYTILPQNDDVRVDGKLTSMCSNNNNSNCQQHIKRGKRKSCCAYIGLLFVCTVIIGAILIPFLVSAECLPNPSDWFIKTKLTLSGHNNNNKTIQKTYVIKNNNSINSSALLSSSSTLTLNANNFKINSTIPVITTTTPPTIKNAFYNDLLNDIQNDDNNQNNKILQNTEDTLFSDEIPIPVKTNREQIVAKVKFDNDNMLLTHTTQLPIEMIVTTVRIASEQITEKQTTSVPITSSSTTTVKYPNMRRLLPPLPPIPVTRKPINLPVLAKTNIFQEDKIEKNDDNDYNTKNWIKSHWPFIDSSAASATTYFHWTSYNVILPAVIGIILIGIILILTICLVSRNRGAIVSSVRKRKRNDFDETAEDNTTLLNTSSLSDDADDE